jgi:ABC-type amino acid transport substrate-binding protein
MHDAQQAQVVDALNATRSALAELGARLPEDDSALVDPFNRAMSGLRTALHLLDS